MSKAAAARKLAAAALYGGGGLSALGAGLYGVLTADHTLPVRVHFDHRVMDGAPVARALAELEDVLNTAIVSELRQMADRPRELPTHAKAA